MRPGPVNDPAFGAEARWPAPAKINRFLHITGRRGDGYHTLQTLFQFLEWGDELEIVPLDNGRLRLDGASTANPADDLVMRAAIALREATGSRRGAHIRVHKRIPPGSGLGGGSSDAATALCVLNRLWDTGLDTAALATIALSLGADVPVFVHGHAAWAEGVGEQLIPFDADEGWCLLALPGCPVSTAAIFGDAELPRNTPPMRPSDYDESRAGNDCEALVRARVPAVDALFGWLAEYGRPRLSGTGGAVFLNLPDRASASRIRAQAPPGVRTVVARRCTVSPLQLALKQAARR